MNIAEYDAALFDLHRWQEEIQDIHESSPYGKYTDEQRERLTKLVLEVIDSKSFLVALKLLDDRVAFLHRAEAASSEVTE
jgi:uncharacterized protein YgfB (UPF0149 family)